MRPLRISSAAVVAIALTGCSPSCDAIRWVPVGTSRCNYKETLSCREQAPTSTRESTLSIDIASWLNPRGGAAAAAAGASVAKVKTMTSRQMEAFKYV